MLPVQPLKNGVLQKEIKSIFNIFTWRACFWAKLGWTGSANISFPRGLGAEINPGALNEKIAIRQIKKW